ncbi:hypothetical protein H4R18_000527 [Coemansia javaensis]|uniref:Uncharacterized protein n=1 Tax=Coemansia javaensis TaxID=2761396 RepID=A0A9W8HNC3_9FUNG|nr:hypothetical protein H4R18_000527 [Coemansia javaensis]
MESLASSIQPEVVPLNVLDTQGSFSNIPFVFFYENKAGEADFMQADLLRDSFYRMLRFFPMLVGHVKSKGFGNVSVVIDPANLNAPDYSEDSSDVHFDELKAAGFRWSAWPEGVATAGPMVKADKKGVIRLINVHVVRLKENSGVMVYFSIPHYVVDGESHMEVMRRWCKIYELMRAGEQDAVDALPGYGFDRAVIKGSLPKERAPLDDETRAGFSDSTYMSEWFSWISPKLRGYILSKVTGRQHAEAHLFHVSAATFESLRTALREHVPGIDDLPVNEILYALVSKTLVQSQILAGYGGKGGATTMIAVVFELRKVLGLDHKDFIGNVLMPKLTLQSTEELGQPTSAETLAQTINANADIVRSVSAPQVGSFVDMVLAQPSAFTRPVVRYLPNKTAISFVYDLMPNMYEADFGYGRPEWVSPIEPFRAHACLLLTPRDPTDGFDVFLTAFPDVMKEVLKNEYWTDVAQLIY